MSSLRVKGFGWGVFLLLLVSYCLSFLPRFPLQSSVLALLPSALSAQVPAEVSTTLGKRLDAQVVFLVAAPGDNGEAAAKFVSAKLQALAGVAKVAGQLDAPTKEAYGRFFFAHKEALLTPSLREKLHSADYASTVLSQLYAGFAGVSAREISADPLLLSRQVPLSLQQASGSKLGLCGDFLCAQDKGQPYYFIHLTLKDSALGLQGSADFVAAVDKLRATLAQQFPGATLYQRGAVFFSQAAAQSAQHDITYLGSCSLILLILLMWGAYRSLLPLSLALGSIVSGAICGLSLVLFVCGEVHAFTFLVGLSVVGMCCDYALYYFTVYLSGKLSAQQALQQVTRTLLLSCAITATAYLLMLSAPFPGVQQMALFCAAALAGACGTVLCWGPLLALRVRPRPLPGLGLLTKTLSLYRGKTRYVLPVSCVLISMLGLYHVQTDDDVRHLAAMPDSLLTQDSAVSSITGQMADQTMLLIQAPDEETLLQRNDALKERLSALQAEGTLKAFQALALNSHQQQQADIKLIAQARAQVATALAPLGLELSAWTPPAPLSLSAFMASPLARGYELALVQEADSLALVVPVQGITDKEALRAVCAQLEGVSFIDRKADFDSLFAHYRHFLSYLVAVALAVMALCFVIRLGLKRGLLTTIPSLLAVSSALGFSALMGLKVNFFMLLALVMVLGVGVNYSLFFANRLSAAASSFLAVSLAMLTTMVSLGILVLSSVPAVSGFGFTLAMGVAVAYVLAPLCATGAKTCKK
ncbi:MAG: MMPL family transporter [Candidatus Anaerobiospirillum merdipullorum]|uniref:MMPL family transporter n=1 Tax=Candidatus Anaerobiospirillum merdipullorum TaxID=2838450 RepID=A0A9E2KNF8_9GAMM|nr:MMPL family transporter [Candidatus Anaerobiospirillum merdipullorum]